MIRVYAPDHRVAHAARPDGGVELHLTEPAVMMAMAWGAGAGVKAAGGGGLSAWVGPHHP